MSEAHGFGLADTFGPCLRLPRGFIVFGRFGGRIGRDLVDDAFLRRIRYKIPILDPSHENYRAIWRIVSEIKGVPYADEIVDYFVEKHMRTFGRPLRGCQPRDILDNILDVCRYRQIEPTVTAEMLDDAAEAYFVKFDDKNYSAIK